MGINTTTTILYDTIICLPFPFLNAVSHAYFVIVGQILIFPYLVLGGGGGGANFDLHGSGSGFPIQIRWPNWIRIRNTATQEYFSSSFLLLYWYIASIRIIFSYIEIKDRAFLLKGLSHQMDSTFVDM